MIIPSHIIVVAGGSGKRMNSLVPKQFLSLYGIPIIAITLNRLVAAIPDCRITVVLPERDISYWHSCQSHLGFPNKINLAHSGPERFHSVKSGLAFVHDNEVVAIHDAVRPLFSKEMIAYGFQVASKSGSAIPVVPVSESMREIDGALSHAVDRSKFRLSQTPQFFQAKLILDAYRQSYRQTFTDDASVAEAGGYRICLIDGNPENIKITTQADLKYAEALLPSFK